MQRQFMIFCSTLMLAAHGGKVKIMEHIIHGRRALITFVCLFQSYLSLGMVYGFSVMYADIIDVFSTSRFNSSLIQGMFNLMSFGGGILWVIPIKRFGMGRSVVIGALLGCFGFLTSSLAQNFQTIIVCTGVISGVGISITYLAPFVIIGLLYTEDPGFPLTLLTVAGSIGQMSMPIVYDALLSSYHWSGAFLLLASLILQCVPCGLLIAHSCDLLASKTDAESSSSNPICNKEFYSDYLIWLFFVTIVILFGTVNFELWFLVDQMISLGHSQQFGTFLLSVLGLANLVGRVVGSVIKFKVKLYPAIYNMFYVCPMIAVGHTFMINLQYYGNWIIAACMLHGLGFGILNAMAPVMAYDLVGRHMFLQSVTQLSLAFGFANLLANFVGGGIRDAYGDYNVAYELGIAASLIVTVGFIVIACVTKRRKKKRESLLLHDRLQGFPYKTIN